jgi:hypothetical protein
MKNIHVLPTDKPSRLSYFQGRLLFDKEQFHKTFISQNIYITSDEEIKEGDWFVLDMSHSSHPNEVHQMGNDNWSKTGGIHFCEGNSWIKSCKKIILTTDQDLIKDGVQAIDDTFLEWFVKNPSCESVKVEGHIYKGQDETEYKIIIPKEEPKQHLIDIMKSDEELGLYEQTKCYCGHTTYCDCGPEQDFKNIELPQQERPETLEEAALKQAQLSYYGDEVDAYVRGSVFGDKWQQERSYSEEYISEKLFNHPAMCRIRDSKSDAEARRIILELLKK